MTHLEELEKFAKDLGINLSKWKLESDELYDLYNSDDNDEYREICYESKVNGEYTLYTILQNFQGNEWIVIEFSIQGD